MQHQFHEPSYTTEMRNMYRVLLESLPLMQLAGARRPKPPHVGGKTYSKCDRHVAQFMHTRSAQRCSLVRHQHQSEGNFSLFCIIR